jgi:hypothetical protein
VHSPRPPAHIAGGVRGSAARYASRPSKKPALPPRVRSAPIPRDLVGGELFKRGIRSVERARHVRAGALLPGDATCAGRRVSSHGREVITEERSPCHGSISLASPGKSSGREGSRRGTSRRQRDPSPPPPPVRPPAPTATDSSVLIRAFPVSRTYASSVTPGRRSECKRDRCLRRMYSGRHCNVQEISKLASRVI